MEKLFEAALRQKLRFQFKGLCSLEDLWDLSVEDLDLIYRSFSSQLKDIKEESLLKVKTKLDERLDLSISIIKYIVETKLAEQEENRNKALNAEKRKRILEIIADKQDDELKGKTLEDLKRMVEGLQK